MISFQPLARLVAICALLIFLGLALGGFVPQYRRHLALERRLEEVRAERAAAEMLFQDLRARQERFQSDREYVRRVAHEIGLVEPDEMIFRFHDESPRSRGGMN